MTQSKPVEKRWQTILSLILSGLGIVLSLLEALGALLLGLFSAVLDTESVLSTIPVGFLAWSFILSALLLMPVLLLSIYQLKGKAVPKWLDTGRPEIRKVALWAILAWPLLAFLGWWLAGLPQEVGLVLGLVNIFITGLPVLWILTMSQSKLSSGSQTRKWRIFGFSIMVMPSVIIFIEMSALVGIVVVAGLIFLYHNSIDPSLTDQLNFVLMKVSLAPDVDSLISLLKPYLLRPTVIFTALAIFSGIIPLIEEIFKPAALWALAGKELEPKDGFVGGLISGAAFALMENLLYFSSAMTADEWLTGAFARSTTGVLHMLGSGLVGWGLVKAWQAGKWGVLARNLVIAIVFHGIWNAMAIFGGIGPILVFGVDATLWQNLLFYLPLVFILILAFIALMLINRHFRKGEITGTPNELLLEGNSDCNE